VKDVVFLARCIFECQKTPTILEYPYALGCFFEHVIFYVGIWVICSASLKSHFEVYCRVPLSA
ncbi:MAG: hypothetical protein L3J28_06845, partial [Candidatus Polarisedimenticolaceae bacterium]|nr:hypothetical protein [Candidatus Polarisedimenticolaceae bacterium]